MVLLRTLSKLSIIGIHESLDFLIAKGFNNESNLDFLFYEIGDFLASGEFENSSEKQKVARVAGLYLFHIIRGHCFNDGNKRTAFLAASTLMVLNKMGTNYDEGKVDSYLRSMTDEIDAGREPYVVFSEMEKRIGATYEFRLIKLLFDLAGARGVVYNSVSQILPLVEEFMLEKGPDVSNKGFLLGRLKDALRLLPLFSGRKKA